LDTLEKFDFRTFSLHIFIPNFGSVSLHSCHVLLSEVTSLTAFTI
jgi:hypothetical protein